MSGSAGAGQVPLRRGTRRVPAATCISERKDRTTESSPDKTCAVDPALRTQRVGQDVELHRRNVEVLAQRRMRRVDERAAAGQVAGPERSDERADALVLAHDVTHAPRER